MNINSVSKDIYVIKVKQQIQTNIKEKQNKQLLMQTLQNNAVQQRIKKLMKEKKLAKQNQFQTENRKRVTSQTILQDSQKGRIRKQSKGDEMSIRSDWTRRNTGPPKYQKTQNSESTTTETSGQSSRVEVERIVNQVFAHSPKLTEYLQQYALKKQEALSQLLNNDLFILSLSSKISKLSSKYDQKDSSTSGAMNGIVQNEIIFKLTKINRKKKQSLSLFSIQNKIKSLINNRLDLLNKY